MYEGDRSRKSTLVAMGSLLAAAVLAGLCVFAFLTRRLTRLARVVESFSASALQSPPDSQASREIRELASGGAGDEIDTLSRTFAVMAERIVEQFERLQDNERLRRELIGNVSHDLRTPLAALQGYVDTLRLKGNDLNEEERRLPDEDTMTVARGACPRWSTTCSNCRSWIPAACRSRGKTSR